MRVPVQRLEATSGPQAISWSNQGDIAIASTAGGVVLVSLKADPATGGQPRYLKSDIAEEGFMLAESCVSSDCIIGAGGLRPQTSVAVDWSIPGAGPYFSCALAVLKSTGDALVHSSATAGQGPWRSLHIGQAIAEKMQIRIGEPEALPRLRIRALSWSPDRPALAVGTESCEIYVLEYEDGICKSIEPVVVPNLFGIPTHIAWLANDQLALATSANTVVRSDGKVIYKSESQIQLLRVEGSTIIVVQPGCVCVSAINDEKAVYETGCVLPAIAILKWDEQLIVLYDTGLLIGVRQEIPAATKVAIERRFGLSSTADEIVHVHGVAKLGDWPCMAILTSTYSSDPWRYPIPSAITPVLKLNQYGPRDAYAKMSAKSVSNVAFREWLLVSKLSANIEERTCPKWPAIESSDLCAAISVVITCPAADFLREQIIYGGENAKDTTSKAVAEIRLQISNAVLQCNLEQLLRSDNDRAVLYIQQQIAGMALENTKPLHLVGDGIGGDFDFSKTKPEDEIIADNCGRRWRRCAITRLPLMLSDTLSATESKHVILNPKSIAPGLCRTLLSSTYFCPFDGARWTERQI